MPVHAGNILPTRSLTLGFNPIENRTINFVEIFREDLKIWTKQNNKSREEFCDLIGKPSHWLNKILTGDWNVPIQDIGRICFVLRSRRLIEAIEQDYQGYDSQLRLIEIEEEKRRLVHRVSELQWEARKIQKQSSGR